MKSFIALSNIQVILPRTSSPGSAGDCRDHNLDDQEKYPVPLLDSFRSARIRQESRPKRLVHGAARGSCVCLSLKDGVRICVDTGTLSAAPPIHRFCHLDVMMRRYHASMDSRRRHQQQGCLAVTRIKRVVHGQWRSYDQPSIHRLKLLHCAPFEERSDASRRCHSCF